MPWLILNVEVRDAATLFSAAAAGTANAWEAALAARSPSPRKPAPCATAHESIHPAGTADTAAIRETPGRASARCGKPRGKNSPGRFPDAASTAASPRPAGSDNETDGARNRPKHGAKSGKNPRYIPHLFFPTFPAASVPRAAPAKRGSNAVPA